MMMFVSFWRLLGKGDRGGVFYIPLSSLKIVDSVYASQHCVALVPGATQTKNSFCKKIHALDTIQREYICSHSTPARGESTIHGTTQTMMSHRTVTCLTRKSMWNSVAPSI